MIKAALLSLAMFLSDVPYSDRMVVEDFVDVVEMNVVYHEDGGDERFTQIIWWEFRPSVLTPEKDKEGNSTGDWSQKSGHVVVDFRMLHSQSAWPDKIRQIVPYKENERWVCFFYDSKDDCYRRVYANSFIRTDTLDDREAKDAKKFLKSWRKGLTKPPKDVRIKKMPPDIEELIDRPVEITE